MTERNPLVRWCGYLEDSLKSAFSGDAEKVFTETVFKDTGDLEKFIGCSLADQYKSTV